jgi:hypothetical protein
MSTEELESPSPYERLLLAHAKKESQWLDSIKDLMEANLKLQAEIEQLKKELWALTHVRPTGKEPL